MRRNLNYVIATRSLVIAALALAIGCSANYPGSPTPTPSLARLELQYLRSHISIAPGSTESLNLFAVNTEGVFENVTSRAAWTTSDSRVAQASGNGSVRGLVDGTVTVFAAYQGLTATTPIVIRTGFDPDISFIGVINVNETIQPTVRIGNPNRVDITSQCTWTSADPGVIAVDGGRLTGRAPGTTAIDLRCPTVAWKMYVSVPPLRQFITLLP